MAVNWSLLSSGDAGGAFQAGFTSGRQQRRQMETESALTTLARNPQDTGAIGALRAFAPDVAAKFDERALDARKRDALSRVFSPGMGVTPQPVAPSISGMPSVAAPPVATPAGALSTFVGGASSSPGGAPPPSLSIPAMSGMSAVAAAPTTLVDPSQLPPRTDGMRINQNALRDLYASDPQSAIQIQKAVFDADEASFKRMQQSGGVMAQAAYHLSTFKNPDGTPDIAARQRELQAMAPQLVALGLQPEALAQADLSDAGVNRYMSLGRSISDLVREDRADRQLDWNMQDDRIDNDRADRSERRQEYYRSRSDSRAERQDARSAVRFRERDKDRAAIAAGVAGIRTDLSDLDY